MQKKELRKIFKKKRLALSHSEMERMNDLILLQFQTIPLPFLTVAHSYIASEKHAESDTSHILRFLQFRYPGIIIAAPRIDADGTGMSHYIITNFDQLELNKFGIEEPPGGKQIDPVEIDLVLIPMLAFDAQGYRVGFGKGYYDRFLAHCRKDTLKIGLSFFAPVDSIEDTDPHDIKLDYCCTPERTYKW
ncbi:MAG TPA: 5-formyltetrahydrofolate cyclo-ligase [Ginsengibacter sp.]|nr:5-formyltetrahydrofolate cyclo-ligase [Ginsengibacter sp.]HRP18690.1 5-formyltetrahydrofolate cyclo-ligase [Ginsengibacter sp.]HRP44012.1 5-formyltetrahydrofolate cyclo-ligase [Ginsengibacter sp.]